jgi:hypothetical protein
MRKIRQVLEYRFSRKISADQTALALSLSKGSVINCVERFEQSKLAWPLPETLTDTALEEALFPGAPQIPDPDLPVVPYRMPDILRKSFPAPCNASAALGGLRQRASRWFEAHGILGPCSLSPPAQDYDENDP